MTNMLEKHFMPDTIVLIKPDGIRTENIKAKVYEEAEIKILDITLQIEPRDIIERTLPSFNLTETYEVLSLHPQERRRSLRKLGEPYLLIKVKKLSVGQTNNHNLQSNENALEGP
jgi:hypothetical protein